MEWYYILLIVLGFLLLLLGIFLFIGLLIIYKEVFYTPHKNQGDDLNLSNGLDYQGHEVEALEMISNLCNKEYELCEIKSFDRLTLRGYLYKSQNNSNKVAIMCHGYRGTPRRDFSGGAAEIMSLGYNVLLINERGHCDSEGHSITFGVREQYDVLNWISYVKQRFGEDVQILLVGISMGGATVLFVSDKIDKNIKIIADCPYSSPKDIICNTIRKLKMSPKIFFPFTNLCSLIFCHTNLLKADASKSIASSDNKILIIHGTADTVVPYTLSKKLYLEHQDKIRYELFEGAEHGISYLLDKERYRKVVREFLEE